MTIPETVITQWTCEHPNDLDGTITWFLRRPDPNIANQTKFTARDWEFALAHLAKRLTLDTPGHWTYPAHLESIQLCYPCSRFLPSEQKQQPQKPLAAEEETSELQEFLERADAGDSFYFCSACNEFIEPEDLVALRECPHCEEVFNGNDGRNCPSCNRPFSRNLEVEGCANCLDAESPPELATVELIQGIKEVRQ